MADHQRGKLTISDVSLLLGIPVPTIRSWERRYGFPSPARTPGRHRRYDAGEVERLRALRDEISAGVRAAEAIERVGRRSGADGDDAGVARAIADAGLAYDAPAIRSLLGEAALVFGFDAAVERVVLPAVRRVGELWEAGDCDVANEHLTTHEVRAWLARQAAPEAVGGAGPVLVAAGPRDEHTIGIEALHVLLTRRRVCARLLGAATPVASLVAATRAAGARAVVVSSHMSVNRRAAAEAIAAVAELGGADVFYAGNAFSSAGARAGVRGTYLGSELVAAADAIVERLAASPDETAPSRA
ncbi:MAG TPA: MerR family transcriptional regulator [Actinomycetota bacterium]|nr:MerR family transcriptional regulator [Actinomycetota bacterium]